MRHATMGKLMGDPLPLDHPKAGDPKPEVCRCNCLSRWGPRSAAVDPTAAGQRLGDRGNYVTVHDN